jgi:putative ABC transport system substrate-binding protein
MHFRRRQWKRREFITLGSAAAAWPLAAHAQKGEQLRRVGVLMNGNERDPVYRAYVADFVQALQRLGWLEGQNLRIDLRWPPADPERIGAYAAELVGMTPNVILCSGSGSLAALLRTTRSIKAVFVLVSDPVAQGFVTNLAHPGGNVTGFSAFEPSTAGKWLDLLKQARWSGNARRAFARQPTYQAQPLGVRPGAIGLSLARNVIWRQ